LPKIHGMERMGIFPVNRSISASRFTGTESSQRPRRPLFGERKNFNRLDKRRLAQCYDTTTGAGRWHRLAGFKGAMPDRKRKRGLQHRMGILLASCCSVCRGFFFSRSSDDGQGHGVVYFLKKGRMAPVNPGKWSGIPVKGRMECNQTAVSCVPWGLQEFSVAGKPRSQFSRLRPNSKQVDPSSLT